MPPRRDGRGAPRRAADGRGAPRRAADGRGAPRRAAPKTNVGQERWGGEGGGVRPCSSLERTREGEREDLRERALRRPARARVGDGNHGSPLKTRGARRATDARVAWAAPCRRLDARGGARPTLKEASDRCCFDMPAQWVCWGRPPRHALT